MKMKEFYGQAEQDRYVLNMVKHKRNGFFIEIGSNDPIKTNNTYLLERDYEWKGIMIEYKKKWIEEYKTIRPNSVHKIKDATKINYRHLFNINNVPLHVDYLQVDLEVDNGSTLTTLNKLDVEVMDKYKFATVTFEHDIYHTNYLDTREQARILFKRRGYILVFPDINNHGKNKKNISYEDWYAHPDLIDMDHVSKIMEKNKKYYKEYEVLKFYVNRPSIGKSIYCKDIEYL